MIRRTRWQTLLAVAVATGTPSYALSQWWLDGGGNPLPMSPVIALVLLALAAALFAMGRSVRRFVLGTRPPLDPLRAFRVLVLAKASALAGSAQLGFHTAQIVVLADTLGAPGGRALVWSNVLNAAACTVLVGVALLVEWYCRVPPVDSQDEAEGELTP